MKEFYIYKEIIKYYFLSYKEIYESLFVMYVNCFKIKNKFKNIEMENKLKNSIQSYLNNVYKELEILDFILKNEKKLYASDIYHILDEIDKNFEERFKFYEDLHENLQTAFDMELDYKFYIPRKRYKDLTKKDIDNYKSYVMGFNETRVKEFLEDEGVISEDEFDEVYKSAQKLGGNVNKNLELFGIYSKKIVLPVIKDPLSTLINIHEITHFALIENKEKLSLDDSIANCEDIPIFYELLFKKYNDFINVNIHTTPLALELLESYDDEPFEEQINKLKKIK